MTESIFGRRERALYEPGIPLIEQESEKTEPTRPQTYALLSYGSIYVMRWNEDTDEYEQYSTTFNKEAARTIVDALNNAEKSDGI